MTTSSMTRRPVRAAVTTLLIGAVVAVLAACDRDFTATVSPDRTVSGQVTYSVPREAWDANASFQEPARSTVESELATAFPDGSTTSGEQDGQVFETRTFTGVTFDEFEAALATILGTSADEGADAPPQPSLTFTDGVYRLDVPAVDAALDGVIATPALNRLSLTFPTAVADSNGTVTGKTVTWDFVEHPELTSLSAATVAPRTPTPSPTPSPQPTPTVAVAPGKVVTHGTARVGHRVRVAAPRALTAGATRRYTWLAGGKAVATTSKPSYRLRRAQAGKRLVVQVQYVRTGYLTAVRTARFGKIKR